ncbi:MAG TPA: glycosyltransferase family 4 protein, partial [Candidatus Saccharimonadales bacterium]|nr:glycosyltransferase family 4 protein [Candidatus Saccharimonadales bacterium]
LGVDLRRFSPAGEASGGGAPGIVCTRRQEAIYANHVIVAALGRLAKEGAAFRAVMVGGGPLLESRREQARRLGVASIEFTGQIARDRLGEILRASRIYVSASLSDGTSSSLLEALATGLFPVVSRIRGNLDWIRDGETGLLFDPGDEEGLARALRRALGDEDLRARAAKENRELVEREGSLDRNMERMLSLLDRAARARSR